jgi:hypothetical protein
VKKAMMMRLTRPTFATIFSEHHKNGSPTRDPTVSVRPIKHKVHGVKIIFRNYIFINFRFDSAPATNTKPATYYIHFNEGTGLTK